MDLKQPRIRVAPSLLAADFSRLREEIARVEEGGADLLHLDIMDGHFVPNLSFGPAVVEKIRPYSQLFFDTHAMVSDPGRYAEAFIKAGSNNYTFHIEVADEPRSLIDRIHDLDCHAGVSLNPSTPAEDLDAVIEQVQVVLVMSVWPGFGGQEFMAEVLPKTARLRRKLRPDQRLEIDGGIDPGTAARAAAAGADTMVAGSAIFGAPDPVAAIHEIRARALAAAGGDPAESRDVGHRPA